MEITKQQAIKLFQAIGFKTANKWSDIKLSRKLKRVPQLFDAVPPNTDEIDVEINKILSQAIAGTLITIRGVNEVLTKEKKGRNKDEEVISSTKKSSKDLRKPCGKEQLWRLFQKTDPKNASQHIKEWAKKVVDLKMSTIRTLVSRWKHGYDIPTYDTKKK